MRSHKQRDPKQRKRELAKGDYYRTMSMCEHVVFGGSIKLGERLIAALAAGSAVSFISPLIAGSALD